MPEVTPGRPRHRRQPGHRPLRRRRAGPARLRRRDHRPHGARGRRPRPRLEHAGARRPDAHRREPRHHGGGDRGAGADLPGRADGPDGPRLGRERGAAVALAEHGPGRRPGQQRHLPGSGHHGPHSGPAARAGRALPGGRLPPPAAADPAAAARHARARGGPAGQHALRGRLHHAARSRRRRRLGRGLRRGQGGLPPRHRHVPRGVRGTGHRGLLHRPRPHPDRVHAGLGHGRRCSWAPVTCRPRPRWRARWPPGWATTPTPCATPARWCRPASCARSSRSCPAGRPPPARS